MTYAIVGGLCWFVGLFCGYWFGAKDGLQGKKFLEGMRESKNEADFEDAMEDRDRYEEMLGNLASEAGCNEEWSNLHEHGNCISEGIQSMQKKIHEFTCPQSSTLNDADCICGDT